MHRSVAVVLSCLLLVQAVAQCAVAQTNAPSPSGQDKASILKARVLEIPFGAPVEARLLSKEKLKGEMGDVSNDGFTLRAVNGDPSQSREVSFAELKSIKVISQHASLARPLLKSLIAAGVMAGVIFWAASATK
jgi:hypothetical protein